jgi:GNAT superfamily N-acetyltransferase
MAIAFRTERYADVIGDIKPLLVRHWEEIARNKDTVKLDPDYTLYATLDERGQLLICTARDGDRLVGYAIYFTFFQIHYRKTRWAESDIFWIDPELRLPTVALRLFKFCETELRAQGVKVLHTRAKNAHPAAGRLLEHLGHTPIETVYAKVL